MRQWKIATAAGALLALAVLATGVGAQSGGGYDVSWATIDGGGGTSSGGPYSVTGTSGQPDAGTLSGGPYTVQGGFEAAATGPTSTPTATPPPSATPFPKPNVGVQVAPGGGGTLQTTIAARDAGCAGGNNQLQSIQVTRLTNATVDVATSPVTTISAAPQTVALPSHPASIGLTVHRVSPGQAATAELTVTDGCGSWPTFVGGGAGAF